MKRCTLLSLALLLAASLAARLPDLIPYRKGELWGYCDSTKKIIIPCKFDAAFVFSGDSASATLEGVRGYVQKNGDFRALPPGYYMYGNGYYPTWFQGIGYYNIYFVLPEDKLPRPVCDSLTGLWGYTDRKGKLIIPHRYRSVGFFAEGLATVRVNDSTHGYIDLKGRLRLQFPNAHSAGAFSNGLAIVQMESGFGLVNTKGEWVMQPTAQSIQQKEGMYLVMNKYELYGYRDPQGRAITPDTLPQADEFSEGLAAVQLNDSVRGYIDKTGKLVLPLNEAEEMGSFENGLAIVRQGTGVGLLRKDGSWLLMPVAESILRAGEIFIVSGSYEYLLVDRVGKVVGNRTYEQVELCSNGMLLVRYHDYYEFLDAAGKPATGQRFAGAMPFSEGLAAVTLDDSGWGFINERGEVVIPLKYPRPEEGFSSNGLCSLGSLGFIDIHGTEYWEEAE